MSAITAITVQNSLGVSGIYELPPNAVAEQIESVVTDIGVGAAKTGMLASAEIIEAIAATVARLDVRPFVVDPVAASQHGDALLRPDALDALRSLILPLATLATPNIGEVRLLTGIKVVDGSSAREAAIALHELGPSAVLVKGGHLDGADAVDLLYDGATFIELSAPRLAIKHTHGSGDTLAAATCAALARGLPLVDAVRAGKAYIANAVADSLTRRRPRPGRALLARPFARRQVGPVAAALPAGRAAWGQDGQAGTGASSSSSAWRTGSCRAGSTGRRGQQLGVGALLDDPARLHHQDQVGVADRRQAVRDHEARAVLAQRVHRLAGPAPRCGCRPSWSPRRGSGCRDRRGTRGRS